jgi:chromosome segregation ATPase
MENMPIPRKTDDIQNPDDFVQTECGVLKEITVSVTLHEYRDLVTQLACLRADNLHLEEKLNEAKGLLDEAEKKVTLAEYYRKVAEKASDAFRADNAALENENVRLEAALNSMMNRLKGEDNAKPDV